MKTPLVPGFLAISWLALTAASSPAHAQDVALLVGEWTFNLQASRCPRGLCPQEETRTFEDGGDGYVIATYSRLSRAGGSTFSSYRARHDGGQYPLVRVGPGIVYRPETISFSRVDDRSSRWAIYVNGDMTSSGTSTVSEDGQTYTAATRNGSTLVFRRR
jgi:hypothetical protein